MKMQARLGKPMINMKLEWVINRPSAFIRLRDGVVLRPARLAKWNQLKRDLEYKEAPASSWVHPSRPGKFAAEIAAAKAAKAEADAQARAEERAAKEAAQAAADAAAGRVWDESNLLGARVSFKNLVGDLSELNGARGLAVGFGCEEGTYRVAIEGRGFFEVVQLECMELLFGVRIKFKGLEKHLQRLNGTEGLVAGYDEFRKKYKILFNFGGKQQSTMVGIDHLGILETIEDAERSTKGLKLAEVKEKEAADEEEYVGPVPGSEHRIAKAGKGAFGLNLEAFQATAHEMIRKRNQEVRIYRAAKSIQIRARVWLTRRRWYRVIEERTRTEFLERYTNASRALFSAPPELPDGSMARRGWLEADRRKPEKGEALYKPGAIDLSRSARSAFWLGVPEDAAAGAASQAGFQGASPLRVAGRGAGFGG
eukprot:CAMPEP_0172638120 /NCGR_PEP_ID=MMETSP1068-20121228/212327_1 /TAXON_ID=35684 /ORGANISM="Pseudopedinella elastica, Strain CCMP716" /LENGTH=424 /DNA_ID=CAMNT_0013450953 /DNA_START=418 /DNA_END=1688 /DNA_ORIENTATION=-